MSSCKVFLLIVLVFIKTVVKANSFQKNILPVPKNQQILYENNNKLLSNNEDSTEIVCNDLQKSNIDCSKHGTGNDNNIVVKDLSCKDGYDCLERNILKILDRFETIKSIPIFGETIAIVRSTEDGDPRAVEKVSVLTSRILRYLKTHSIRIRVAEEAARMLSYLKPRLDSEGRGRVKKVFFPLALAVVISLGTLLPILFSGIGLLSIKGLWAGMAALFISTALALRALFSREGPGYAPRLAIVRPQLYPAEVVHTNDFVPIPAYSRTGAATQDLQYRGYPYRQ